jgi:hypothetical protein
MRNFLSVALPALLLIGTHARSQTRLPKIPMHYHQAPIKKVLEDAGKITHYGNVIDDALLKWEKPFTRTGDSLTLPELIKVLNRHGPLYFTISDSKQWMTWVMWR